MGLRLRKLRSRLSTRWSIVSGSKLSTASNSQPPASLDRVRRKRRSGASRVQKQERSGSDESADGPGQAELQWNESRRTYSEPVRVICSTSLASHESSPACSLGAASHDVEPEDDDVFVAERSGETWKESLSWEVERRVAIEEIGVNPEMVRLSTGALDDWVVPADELTLGAVISCGDDETTYRGYWHGNVYVRTRKPEGGKDFGWFLNEVATLSCIRHENIQLFMGVCLDMSGGTLGIIMSEVRGEMLHTRLHKYGHNFTMPSKLKILKQITEGMEYLHDKGIPHGSLSTRCVSLHSRVCIIIPHTRSVRNLKPDDLTSLPPECMQYLYLEEDGRRMVLDSRPTFPEDIFAFGTMVYELMTLQKPFQSLPMETVIWRVGRGEFQSLTLLPKGRLRTIISHCWTDQPSSRATFKDLLTTLEQNVVFTSTTYLKPSLSLPSIPTELSNTL